MITKHYRERVAADLKSRIKKVLLNGKETEIADITISAEDLRELVVLRRLSNALMDRINGNYRRIMTFNGLLIALGLLGYMPSARAALLHNLSTIYFSVDSMKNLL